jgi:hypothetical protein
MPAIGFSFFVMGMMFGAGYIYSNLLFSVSSASSDNENKVILSIEEFEKLKYRILDKEKTEDFPPSYGTGTVDPLLEL